jgi:hypothetical protein
LILKTIFQESRKRRKNLNTARFDNEKAFDSVSRSWIEQSIELIGFNSNILNFAN